MREKSSRLEDVARMAHVSKMTVSLCLRADQGEGRVSLDTRERVINAVRELGYKPNVHARGLRLGRSDVIALYAGHGYLNVRKPYFTEIVSGLQEGCEIARKDLLLQGAFHTAEGSELIPELLNGRVDGLIVDMFPNDPLATMLLDANLAVIAISNEIEGIPSIVVDDYAGSQMIAHHLASLGHQRVAYVVAEFEPLSGQKRRLSFLDAAADLGLHTLIVHTNTEELWCLWIRQMLDMGVTALVCWNDDYARLVLRELLEMGIDVPGRVAVTGFDGCPATSIEKHPLTTIAAPWSEVAKSAVLSLSSILAGAQVEPRVVYPVQFVRGATS